MKSAVYIGRFQPFHNGHLFAIENILKTEEFLYVVIGSAQKSYEPDNPFTAGERIEMITSTLNEKFDSIKGRWSPIPIVDTDSNTLWADYVLSMLPRFDTIYSNNNLVKTLFRGKKKIQPIPSYSYGDGRLSATKIRQMIIAKQDWKIFVPPVVSKFITEIGGERRLSGISGDTGDAYFVRGALGRANKCNLYKPIL